MKGVHGKQFFKKSALNLQTRSAILALYRGSGNCQRIGMRRHIVIAEAKEVMLTVLPCIGVVCVFWSQYLTFILEYFTTI